MEEIDQRDMIKGHEIRSKLSYVTREFKIYEKISVIFLLSEKPSEGLKLMELILKGTNPSDVNIAFYKWFREQKIFKYVDWREKLAELLTYIQNYRLAEVLGFRKTDLKERFPPKNNFLSFHISNVRKVLYNLCEYLYQAQCKDLIRLMSVGQEPVKSINDSLEFKYLECELFVWSEMNIINLSEYEDVNLDVLIKCLNDLALNDFAHDIEVIADKANSQLVRSRACLTKELKLTDSYPILDENNLGLCVIINEKNFTDSHLTTRWGTEKDVERLVEIFTAFRFDIKIHTNLKHKDFLKILQHYSKSIADNHSFFILVLLSHGSENMIYTSDSQPIDMNTIEMIFQAETCPNLIGKPKLFIVQSCQGEKWQKLQVKDEQQVMASTDSALSSPSTQTLMGPQKGDSMIAWSTVQGFASFRDRYNGSWYIQELCKGLWRFGDVLDLVEIFTMVNNNLRSRVYDDQFMVPSLLLSLRAKVRFPVNKNSRMEGKRLMLERIIFEKYLKEFLTDCDLLHLVKFITR